MYVRFTPLHHFLLTFHFYRVRRPPPTNGPGHPQRTIEHPTTRSRNPRPNGRIRHATGHGGPDSDSALLGEHARGHKSVASCHQSSLHTLRDGAVRRVSVHRGRRVIDGTGCEELNGGVDTLKEGMHYRG